MAQAPNQDHRRTRLADLLLHPDFGGVKATLGRALGYKSGAHLRQMLAGERPVSEKTVQTIESMHGGRFRGWFSGDASISRPAETNTDHMVADLVAAFRLLPEDEQAEWVHDIMARAERYNNVVQREMRKAGVEYSGYTSATRAAEVLPAAPPPPAAAAAAAKAKAPASSQSKSKS